MVITISHNFSVHVNTSCGIDEVPILLTNSAPGIVFKKTKPAMAEYRSMIRNRARYRAVLHDGDGLKSPGKCNCIELHSVIAAHEIYCTVNVRGHLLVRKQLL